MTSLLSIYKFAFVFVCLLYIKTLTIINQRKIMFYVDDVIQMTSFHFEIVVRSNIYKSCGLVSKIQGVRKSWRRKIVDTILNEIERVGPTL